MEGGFMWIRGSDSKIIDADNGPTKKLLNQSSLFRFLLTWPSALPPPSIAC